MAELDSRFSVRCSTLSFFNEATAFTVDRAENRDGDVIADHASMRPRVSPWMEDRRVMVIAPLIDRPRGYVLVCKQHSGCGDAWEKHILFDDGERVGEHRSEIASRDVRVAVQDLLLGPPGSFQTEKEFDCEPSPLDPRPPSANVAISNDVLWPRHDGSSSQRKVVILGP
jgi:hypothetical protein